MEKRDSFKVKIGKVIIRLRKEKLWSQEELAYQSGLDRSSIGAIETNKSEPALGTTIQLAKALGMEGHELVKIIEESPDTVYEVKKSPDSKRDK